MPAMIASEIERLLYRKEFRTITLDGLNASSELLTREERKYIVHISAIPTILLSLAERFYVLEHANRRMFRYESVYFDDSYLTYMMHHQGKRRRFKIRSRLYADSGICVFEMKVKRYRGNTDKRRIKYDIGSRFMINPQAREFMEQYYMDAYGKRFSFEPEAVVNVINDRVTFVAKDGGERLTIDFNMQFVNHLTSFIAPNEFVIIETKTHNGNGECDKILRRHGLRPQRWCSKYCIGVIETGLISKRNTFLPVLRLINKCGACKIVPSEGSLGVIEENRKLNDEIHLGHAP